MKTNQDIINYYQELLELIKSEKSTKTFNKDRAHNSIVLRAMFDTSTQINMFCGKLSVLRKDFYNHIRDAVSESISNQLIIDIQKSFRNFINKEGSSLTVIFEDFKDDYFKDLIVRDSFFEGINDNKIFLYKLDEGLTIKKRVNHFSISNNRMVRFEQDKELHNAICTFNDDNTKLLFETIFGKLKAIADPISM